MANNSRPLSPHLSIYRWPISMLLSILHRMTGVALYAGLVLLIVFLCVVAYAPEQYEKLHECLGSTLGQLLLAGWVVSFYIHFFNGIRHLFWDMGQGFEIKTATKTGWLVLVLAAIASAMTFCVAYNNLGTL